MSVVCEAHIACIPHPSATAYTHWGICLNFMELLQVHQQTLPVSKQNMMSEHSKRTAKLLSIVDFGNTVIFSSRGWEPHLQIWEYERYDLPLWFHGISPLSSKAISQHSSSNSVYLITYSWGKYYVRMMAAFETSAKMHLEKNASMQTRQLNRTRTLKNSKCLGTCPKKVRTRV